MAIQNVFDVDINYITSALNAGFDPQNANYNQQFGQQQQQHNVNNAAQGVSGGWPSRSSGAHGAAVAPLAECW